MCRTASWRTACFLLALVGCTQFVVFSAVAMHFYSGGTPLDSSTMGYSLTQNYLSDLGLTSAHSGTSNTTSMILFTVTMCLAGVAVAFFFLAAPGGFEKNRGARRSSIIGSAAGVISGISYIGIGAMPSDVNHGLHLAFVNAAFVTTFLAVVCYRTAMHESNTHPRGYALVYSLFAGIMAVYVVALLLAPSAETNTGLTVHAVGQKIVVYSGILCMLIESYGACQAERRR